MQPFDYTLNVPDPAQSFQQGVQSVYGLRQAGRQEQMSEMALQDAIAKRQQMAEDRASQQAAAQQLAADLAQLHADPNPRAIVQTMVKYPQLSEQLKRAYDAESEEDKRLRLTQATNLYAALQSGRMDIAKSMLQEQSDAYFNAGRQQEAAGVDAMIQMLDADPNAAQSTAAMYLASAMGPDKFGETFAKLGAEARAAELQPDVVKQTKAEAGRAESEAAISAAKAKFAESDAALELEKKGWDIKKIQEDISIGKMNARIALMQAEAAKAGNALKQQELGLKILDTKMARDKEVRERATELESARSGIDNALNTIDRVLTHPELENVLGSVEGSDYYPHTIVGMVSPFSNADARNDAIALLETVQSQAFLNNLMEAKAKGATFGSLTEREGDKLMGYVANLRRKQSVDQFKTNAKEAQRLLLKSRKNLANRYGVPENVPDTPAATPSRSEVDALLKKYGGPSPTGRW
jgi:hypothetical protein